MNKSSEKGRFKSMGKTILKQPGSIGELLGNTTAEELSAGDVHNCNSTKPHMHNSANTQIHKKRGNEDTQTGNSQPSEEVVRIHVQIRKSLADKLLDIVFVRKRDPQVNKRDASQRHIIEEALADYFTKHGL